MENKVEQADALKKAFDNLRKEIAKVIVGQDEAVKLIVLSIFCNGHSLLVGVPGLAKTLLVKTISSVFKLDFHRIQFTPDLMPSDILGSELLNNDRQFQFNKGPIFSNIVLADEINRTPPKTQAALLEAMQERTVTIAGENMTLPSPFFVLATQNPIEQEGTYPLPEAQLDRFMFNIVLDYPEYESEVEIIKNSTSSQEVKLDVVLTGEEILQFQQLVREVPVTDNVVEYAVDLVHRTRPGSERAGDYTREYIDWGAGPRAGQNLILGAKCHALLMGKYSPDIEDVKAVALPILRHRIARNFKADADQLDNDDIIAKLLEA